MRNTLIQKMFVTFTERVMYLLFHIYNIFNAMYNKEKKYQLLLSAWLGGHRIDCFQLDYCDIDQLKEKENEWIKIYKPKLNILTPTGKNDISELRIEQLLNFGKNKGNIGKVVEIRLGLNKDTQLYQNVYMLDNRLWTILEYIVKQNKEITKVLNLANQMLEEMGDK